MTPLQEPSSTGLETQTKPPGYYLPIPRQQD